MSKPPTILIVEDDPVFRRVLHYTVAKSGFNSETASNGEEGFLRLLQGDIDFLVTDLQMPVCSGLELLQRLEALENFQRPNTILCTAKGLELDTEDLKKRFRLTAIMHKPFSPRKLSDLISRTISENAVGESTTGECTRNPQFAPVGDLATPIVGTAATADDARGPHPWVTRHSCCLHVRSADDLDTASIDGIEEMLSEAAGTSEPQDIESVTHSRRRHKPLLTTRVGFVFIVIALTNLICATAALAVPDKDFHALMWIATIAASALGGMLAMRSGRTLRVIETELRRVTGEPSRWKAVRPIIGSDSITEGWNELLAEVSKQSDKCISDPLPPPHWTMKWSPWLVPCEACRFPG